MPKFAVAYWQKVLGEMVGARHLEADRGAESHFVTTFMIGDEFQSFLATTQADVKDALNR